MSPGKVVLALASIGYLAAAAGFQWQLFRGRETAWGRWRKLVGVAVGMHTLGLVLLRFPVTGMAEAAGTLAWAVGVLYLAVGVRWNVEVVGAVAAPAVFAMTAFSLAAGTWEHQPGSPDPWVPLHVASVVIGYGAFCLAAFCALLYFAQARLLKRKDLGGLFQRLPSLDTLDRVSYRLILAGFLPMVLGIATGMLIMKGSQGVWWSWEPQPVLVGFTGLVYLTYLHARLVAGWQGRRVNNLLLVAFLCVLASFLAPGRLHRF